MAHAAAGIKKTVVDEASHTNLGDVACHDTAAGRYRVPTIAGRELHVTVSVGAAIMQPNDTASDFLAAADVAVYEAKAKGRDRVELQIANSLTRSIEQAGDLVPYYQPIVDLDTGQVVGFEALCRWHHPERGLLPANAFIEVAEAQGLDVPIGWSILRDVVAQLADWTADPLVRQPIWASVNVSTRQLRDPKFAHTAKRCIEEAGISPDQLCIEVTERTLMGDLDLGADSLAELREIGVRVAIDDFGTGTSSLGHLRSLPLDIVKLDRSFVQGVADDSEAHAIVAAVVEMTRTLGHAIVAEGIETSDQLDALRTLRCGSGQGYLFAAALPPEAATEMLVRDPLLTIRANGA